ncbi:MULTISPECIES: pyridoxal phosphate-dependent decarboxylase family protein [Prauserella salsuginis group]|uniref:Pyridoxal phosphate-dependent decarboxylase family protein n=1 Tax=Prauserella salsuginis TaxID=387889 RepID=A0ABW6G429_9PSEU|nr:MULTISPECIES: aminotransferase class V-fold PLP-dependent enzyme [Prauserella salsuginis group]MCR3718288.1 Glutamate or tyrosine decarboxylase [Prauserella flava]MCR3732858.1 Glutamate or tyrosine decarboxylase [Prauserella salsuginis]
MIPGATLGVEEVLAELTRLRSGDAPTHGGRTLAYVYDSGLAELDELAARAHAAAVSANGLDPTAFPSLLRMENDLVAAAIGLLGGGPDAVGTATSGGTESCLLAVLAAREGRRDVADPSVVVPSTVHAAFRKAGHLFGVRVVDVPVDPVTFRADPVATAAAVDDTTVLVVGSAPSYAHGVVDPIAELAAVAGDRGARMHVDACIGGWVLPYLRRGDADGRPPVFDLSVPGVTSLSVDLHKYAYCAKGVSVLLHAGPEQRRGHYFASADWPGYTMLNPTLQSTRSGGPIAAAWAVVRHVGDDGYAQLALSARAATERIRDGLAAIDGLRVLGDPDATLLAVALDGEPGFDLFTVADELAARGWHVQPQFPHRSSPANLHLTVTASNRGHEDALLTAVQEAVGAARAAGPVTIDADLAALIGALDPDTLTEQQFAGVLAAAGLDPATGDGAEPGHPLRLPERMAEINTMLAAASPRLRERLLAEFLGLLYRP